MPAESRSRSAAPGSGAADGARRGRSRHLRGALAEAGPRPLLRRGRAAMRLLLTAELAKQRGQRAPLAWGFLAVPAFATFLALALEAALPAAGGAHLAASVHPIRSGIRILSIAGNPFAQLFYAIGGAAFFTVESPRDLAADRAAPQPRPCWRRRCSASPSARPQASLCSSPAISPPAPSFRSSAGSRSPTSHPRHGPIWRSPSQPRLLDFVAFGGTVALLAVVTRSTLGALLPAFLLLLRARRAGGDAQHFGRRAGHAAAADLRGRRNSKLDRRDRGKSGRVRRVRRHRSGGARRLVRPHLRSGGLPVQPPGSRDRVAARTQNGILKPGGSCRPPVTSCIAPCAATSALARLVDRGGDQILDHRLLRRRSRLSSISTAMIRPLALARILTSPPPERPRPRPCRDSRWPASIWPGPPGPFSRFRRNSGIMRSVVRRSNSRRARRRERLRRRPSP